MIGASGFDRVPWMRKLSSDGRIVCVPDLFRFWCIAEVVYEGAGCEGIIGHR